MQQEQTNESFFANPQQESFPLFRTGKARFQAKVQTDSAWHVVERVVSAAVAAGNAAGVYSILWPQYPPLHHIPVLRQPGFFLFQGIHQWRYERSDGKPVHYQQSQCAKVYVPAFKIVTVPVSPVTVDADPLTTKSVESLLVIVVSP